MGKFALKIKNCKVMFVAALKSLLHVWLSFSISLFQLQNLTIHFKQMTPVTQYCYTVQLRSCLLYVKRVFNRQNSRGLHIMNYEVRLAFDILKLSGIHYLHRLMYTCTSLVTEGAGVLEGSLTTNYWNKKFVNHSCRHIPLRQVNLLQNLWSNKISEKSWSFGFL